MAGKTWNLGRVLHGTTTTTTIIIIMNFLKKKKAIVDRKEYWAAAVRRTEVTYEWIVVGFNYGCLHSFPHGICCIHSPPGRFKRQPTVHAGRHIFNGPRCDMRWMNWKFKLDIHKIKKFKRTKRSSIYSYIYLSLAVCLYISVRQLISIYLSIYLVHRITID